MRVIVDAMSGDNAPHEIVKGALEAAAAGEAEIILTGREGIIRSCIESLGSSIPQNGVEIIDASEVIEFDDDPATAIRNKKNSSMTVGLDLLRNGGGDAMVSAGNTGALLSGATLIVKRARGVRRAALAPVVPNSARGFILIDCGANSECTSEYLLQFAYMGSYYAEGALDIKSPRIGLLNNGTEPTKGTPLQLETYALLEKANNEGKLNFVGNIEAKDAVKNACDVLVCDGFTGNILLKAIEGTASLIMSELKSVFNSTITTKLSALLVKNNLLKLKQKMSADTVGGTMLLGISKPVLKAHGSSNASAIRNAIRQAVDVARSDVIKKLEDSIGMVKGDVVL